MSTSDAADLELGVVGGETPPPAYGTATRPATEREPLKETFAERFHPKKHHVAETKTGQLGQPSTIRQEETDKAQILRANKQSQEEASRCGDLHVLSQKPSGPRVTSYLYFRLSANQGLEKPELGLKKNLDSCQHSLTERHRAENENSRCQVNGQASPLGTFVKVTRKSTLSERILAKKEEDVITATSDLRFTHSFPNGEALQHECHGSHIHPCMPKSRTGAGSVDLEEDIKDHTKLEKQADFGELSNPTSNMLSSSMVTVLAPHWSGRLRRTKQFDTTCILESHGNLQDMVNTSVHDASEHFQETADRSLTGASQAQLRVPFLASRKNALNWSAKSGPARLDYESKRKMIHTVSLDINSGKNDSGVKDAGLFSPVAGTGSPVSSLSVDPNEQRRNSQMSHEGLSSLSSKPTTSSLLLSLRRFNSSGKIPNATFNVTEKNPSPADRDGQIFTTHLSQNFHNNNVQDMPKPRLSPPAISDGTTESGPILSPSSSNHRGRTLFETRLLSSSSTSKGTAGALFTQQPQTTNRAQPSLSSQAFLSRESSERQVNSRGLDKNTNPLSESSVSSTRHSPYNHSPLLKSHSLPRTTLTSSSWWKQVTQEDSSLLKLKDKANIADKPNTPNNDKRDSPSPSWTNNKIFSGQILDDRDNNNTTESIRKCNMNLVMKTQGEIHNFKQRNAEDSPKDESNWLIKQKYDSNLNIRGPQKPHSLPDDLSSSKNGRGAAQTIVTHPTELTRPDLTFTENVMKIQPTLLNPKNANTRADNGSKYDSNHFTPKTNSVLPFTHNTEAQILTKPSPSLVSSSNLNSQALTSKTGSGFSLISPTPIGFERSYSSVPRPLHPKTVTTLIPTVNALSKSNYSPVSNASSVSPSVLCMTGSHTAATTVPNPSSLTTPVTPTLASSPTTVTSSLLTPPATPVITSPNYSDTSSPKEKRTLSDSQKGGTKKLLAHAEEKRARRVTWHDSVDVSCSEAMSAEMQEPISSSTASRSPQSVNAPSIFSLLRSSSPPKNTYRLCSVSPKTSTTQMVKGERYKSLSSDPADLASREQEKSQQTRTDTMISDHGRRNLTTPRHERALSVESGIVRCHSSTPLSLPPDFSSGYKLRYSTPPYSTLMSTRSSLGETKTLTPRSPLFQQPPQSMCSPCTSTHNDPDEVTTSKKLPCTTVSLSQPLSLSIKTKSASRESSKCEVSETDKLNNNNKDKSPKYLNGQISLVNNRVHVNTQSLPGDKADRSSSTFVTETLVYGIKSKVDPATTVPKNTTPKQHTRSSPASLDTSLNQQSHRVQSKETTGHSDRGLNGSNSPESQPPDDERSNRRMKETVVGKSRFFSVESNNEQNPKKSRLALKKSVSTLNSNLSRSESDRASKTSNRMDQVLNKLRQTFSTRRSEDDSSFPRKWRRASQTPSLSGSSDISAASAVTVEGTKSLVKQEKEEGQVLKDKENETVVENTCAQNRYTLTATSASEKTPHGSKFCVMSETFPPDSDKDKQNSCPELMSKKEPHSTHSSTAQQLDLYEDNGTNYKPTNKFISCRDRSPGRTPNPSAAYPSQFRESASSPRNPFSPFSSLSPFSSFPPPDLADDVFYSPKLQRRRESSSPCEPGEGISLGGSRKSRASTGTPSPGHDKQCFASTYADLKYGIEPGRSFSVSSVLSSRPSGPGRISTGSRFMSVGDLYESAMTCGVTGEGLDHWSVSPDWDNYNCHHSKDCWMSYFPGNTGKIKSRSLPRSLTRRLANWTSGVSGSPSDGSTTSKLAHLWGSQMNTGRCAWNTESPPTPPPTPPLSPVSRRMSTPPRHSSPTFSSSSGTLQQADSQSSRGRLPSRGYISSLSTFEEFSDTNSDTTTDDEYYLETGEEEKETEL